MMFLSRAESSYLHQHLSVVRHVTLDPEGAPGVLRIHLLPLQKSTAQCAVCCTLNGQDIFAAQRFLGHSTGRADGRLAAFLRARRSPRTSGPALPPRLWKPPLLFTRKRLPTRSARI